MKGICIKFYTYELQKHKGKLLYDWLLEFAKKNGVHGGSVVRAIAGFGSHGVIHEEHFFELASNVPIQIEFIVSKEESQLLIDKLTNEGIKIFYQFFDVEYDVINREAK